MEIEDLELAFMYYGYDNKYTYDAIQEIINSGNIETLDKSLKNTITAPNTGRYLYESTRFGQLCCCWQSRCHRNRSKLQRCR